FVAGFVGTSNVLGRDGRRVLIRPERIRLLAGGEDAPGALKGVVREVAYLGSVTRYVVESEHGETIVVLRQNLDTSAEQARQERGREVRLAWRAEDASVLEKEDRPALHAGLQEDRPAHRAGLESQQEADA